jgi:hypothetical protein
LYADTGRQREPNPNFPTAAPGRARASTPIVRACCHDRGFEAVQRVYLDVLEVAWIALDQLADHIAAVT